MNDRMPTKDVLYDISSMREFAKQLVGKNKDYEEFLKYILEHDYYYDEELHLPTIKQLEQETGLKYTTIRKYVQSIYRDLHDSNDLDFSIYQTEYTFYMRYFEKRASITLKKLPVIPRIGEQIHIPFFRTMVGTTSFFVDQIYHHLTEKKQEITFYLKPGLFNHYWKIRKDEAILKGEINRDEYWDHMDFDAKKKLHLNRW